MVTDEKETKARVNNHLQERLEAKEDPSATSTTADSASWQGDDTSGVGTEDWGYYGEDWYQSGWCDSFTFYCVERIEWSDKMDRPDEISHARENAATKLTVNAFGACAEGA